GRARPVHAVAGRASPAGVGLGIWAALGRGAPTRWRSVSCATRVRRCGARLTCMCPRPTRLVGGTAVPLVHAVPVVVGLPGLRNVLPRDPLTGAELGSLHRHVQVAFGLGVPGQQGALPYVPAEWAAPAFIQPRGAAGSREHGCLVTQAVEVESGRPPILLHLAEPLIRDPLDVLVVFVVCVAFGQLAGAFRIAPVVDAASVVEVLELDHLGVSQSATHAAY